MNPSYCPVTNERNCKCLPKQEGISALKVDLRSALRKLFTDHGVYTAFVLKSIVDNGKDTSIFLDRLLINQKDIGDQLKPIIGIESGNKITEVLTLHIKLAGDVIKAARNRDNNLQNKIDLLFANSDIVAETLTSLNPIVLPFEVTQDMFHVHNQFVIDMTISRITGDFLKEQQLYDAYYNELLMLSDSLFSAL
jgi:hypothetical protein